jgi:hypothetical protein
MALGSIQTLTKMNTRNFGGGKKNGRCVRLTTLPPSGSRLYEPSRHDTGIALTLPYLKKQGGSENSIHMAQAHRWVGSCDLWLKRQELLE